MCVSVVVAFLPVHMGPRSNILSKKMVKNLVKLSLGWPLLLYREFN